MATEVIKTIRSSGGDYTTLTAWEAAQQGNLVSLDEVHTAECYDDWPSGLDDLLTISGSTTDSTRYMKITVAAGERHAGLWGEGFSIVPTTTGTVITISDEYTVVEWARIQPNAGGGSHAVIFTSGADGGSVHNCIIDGQDSANITGIYSASSPGCLVYRNIVYGCGHSGDGGIHLANTAVAMANTVVASYYGIRGDGGTVVAQGNVCLGNIHEDFYGTFDGASDYNADSDATAPGTHSLSSLTDSDQFEDLTGGSEDFHLKAGADLIDAGTNLGSPYDVDIDGETVTGTWDIGADEYIAAGSPAIQAAAAYAVRTTPAALTASAAYAVKTTPTAAAKGLQYALLGTPYFVDKFARADSGTIGNGWTEERDSAWSIASGKAHFVSDGSTTYQANRLYRPAAEDFTDGRVQVDFVVSVTTSAANPMVVARMQGTGFDTYYLLYVTAANLTLAKRTPGFTSLTSTAYVMSLGTNYRLELDLAGTALAGRLWNLDTGAVVASVSTTDSDISSGGRSGVSGHTGGTTDFDNFKAGAIESVIPTLAAEYRVTAPAVALQLGATYHVTGEIEPVTLSLGLTYHLVRSIDDFDRADSATVGNGWTEERTDAWEILSNKARFTGDGTTYRANQLLRPSGEDFSDGTVAADIRWVSSLTAQNPQVQLRASGTDHDDFYLAWCSNTTFYISKYISGTGLTALDSVAVTLAADTDYRVTFAVIGTTLRAWLRNVATGEVLAQLESTDSEITGPGSAALSAHQNGAIDFDNFRAEFAAKGLLTKGLTYAIQGTAIQKALRYSIELPQLLLLERFTGTLSAWTLGTAGGTATIATRDEDEKLVLDKTTGGSQVSATRGFDAPDGTFLVEADLNVAAGPTGRMEVLDASDNVLFYVQAAGPTGQATFATDAVGSTSFSFGADYYRMVVFLVDRQAAEVTLWRTEEGPSGAGNSGSYWEEIATKAWSGAVPAKVRFVTAGTGTGEVLVDEVKVFQPELFCIGDSLTAGIGNEPDNAWNPNPEFWRRQLEYEDEAHAYPDALGKDFTPDHWAPNRGVSGDTAADVAARLASDALDQGAQAVVLMIGTNDIAASVTAATLEADIAGIMSDVAAAGVPLYLCTIPPADSWDATKNAVKDEVNGWIRDQADGTDVKIVEVHDAIEDPANPGKRLPAYASYGNVHLTQAGYEAIAARVFAKLSAGPLIEKTSRYVVTGSASAALGAAYTVVTTPAAATLGADYDVVTTPAAIGKSAAYRVANTPSAAALGLSYELVPVAGRVSRALTYAVRRTAPGIPAAQVYAVRTPATPFTRSLAYEIDPAVHVLVARGLTYQLRVAPARTLGLAYSLEGEPAGALHTVAVPSEPHGAVVPPETHTVQVTQ